MSYARSAVTRMTLDISRPDLQRSETVTLGDTNRRWEVTLTNGGAPFRLPPNWTAALTGIKPDGTGILNGCSVADGKIVYDFAAGAEIATCAGSYPVQFDIWDEVGELVASPKVYVNVLADVRPHAELESNGQYTLIGDAIKKITDMEKDVDLLGDTALAQGDDIAALKKKVTTAGSVTIPASEWTDTLPKLAFPEQPVLAKGTVALLMPSDTDSQNAARKAKITVQSATYGGGKIVIQREDGEAPTGNITLDYIIIKVDNPEAPPKAALIGVDAYGEGGGTASGVDETAVKKIINSLLGNVKNERQYSADNPPPYPVTSVNGKTGAVTLTIPSEAADVDADPAGTAERKTTALRQEVSNALDARLKSADLPAKLDEYRAAKGLIDNTVSDLVNYYTKSQTLTKDEINALVSAIPKFDIEVVASLPIYNISETTVYLVKSGADSSNLYTEYIRANGAWEKLGTQSVDLTGYATEAWVNELIAAYVKTADMEAYVAGLLKAYITKDEADGTYQPKGDYLTASDLPTIPNKLPNPHALTINGKTYDGSAPVSVTVDGSGEETTAIILPSKLYAVEGHEFVLYYDNILRCMIPDDFLVTTDFGSSAIKNLNPQYERMLKFTPTTDHVGEHAITIKVISRRTWATVATKTVTLVVSADTARVGREVMILGDSLTEAGKPLAELSDVSNGGIVSVGTKSNTITFKGADRTVYYEGTSGMASYDFPSKAVCNNGRYNNPFYNADVEYSFTCDKKYYYEPSLPLVFDNSGPVTVYKHHFDFAYYMTNHPEMADIDAVFLNLGTNGGNLYAIDYVQIGFDVMISKIREWSATIPIFVYIFPPTAKWVFERGANATRNANVVSDSRLGYYDTIQRLIDRYDNDSRVIVVPTYTMLDREYDFKATTAKVSARSEETVRIGDPDSTHPATSGYYHIADSMYFILQALWSGATERKTFKVTNNLMNVTTDNFADEVVEGSAYKATLTAVSGYELGEVSVTMKGSPVTVTDGVINIASVNGDIIITATAVESTGKTNLADPSKLDNSNLTRNADVWLDGYAWTSTGGNAEVTSRPGCIVSNRIPIQNGQKLIVKGIKCSTAEDKNRFRFVIFDAAGNNGLNTFYSPLNPDTYGYGWADLDKAANEGIIEVVINKAEDKPAFVRVSGYTVTDSNGVEIYVE